MYVDVVYVGPCDCDLPFVPPEHAALTEAPSVNSHRNIHIQIGTTGGGTLPQPARTTPTKFRVEEVRAEVGRWSETTRKTYVDLTVYPRD